MASKRMFDLSVVRSDAFLDMPLSVQALYFHLGMNADDDGFVTPRMIMRMLGSTQDDLKILVAKQFVIPFDDGVVVIRDWKNNNLIRSDRYKPTIYQSHLKRLKTNDNGAYFLLDNQQVNQTTTIGIPSGNQVDTNNELASEKSWYTNGTPSIVKNSIVKNSIDIPDMPSSQVSKRIEKTETIQQEIIRFCREVQGIENHFPNYPKQAKALSEILKANYSYEDIRFVITEMAKEDWWKTHTFDMTNVLNNMMRYMNKTVMYNQKGKSK